MAIRLMKRRQVRAHRACALPALPALLCATRRTCMSCLHTHVVCQNPTRPIFALCPQIPCSLPLPTTTTTATTQTGVVCRQLGYQAGAVLAPGTFGPGSGPIQMDGVYCSPINSRLQDCYLPYGAADQGGHDFVVGVGVMAVPWCARTA